MGEVMKYGTELNKEKVNNTNLLEQLEANKRTYNDKLNESFAEI